MNTNGAYMDKMHDLFFELEKASQIFILGRKGSDIDMFTGETSLEIISVNKCKTPKAYGIYISRVCRRLVDRAMEEQADLRPGTRAEFLQEVKVNFGHLLKATLFNQTFQLKGKNQHRKFPTVHNENGIEPELKFSPVHSMEGEQAARNSLMGYVVDGDMLNKECPPGNARVYLFRSITVSLEAGMEITAPQVEHFRKLAFRYSREWRRTIKKTRAMIERLAEIADYLPDNQERKGPAENKIIIKGTGSRLATLARVFFDIDVFATSNKSELCRCFIKNFGTVSHYDLSAKQFKKRFDIPESDSIDYLKLELKGMLDVLDKLEKRYN